MGVFNKPFVKAVGGSVSSTPSNSDKTITVYDKDGGALSVSLDQWKDKVLPATIQKFQEDANGLYQLVVQSLKDGFIDEIAEASERLFEIDSQSPRSAVVLGIVYMKANKLDDAERVLEKCIEKHGENGAVLTNLAKIHKVRGDDELAEETLWRALEIDPNLSNGLLWYAAIHRERDGMDGWLDAMSRMAARSGSWRAQLWLAQAELTSKNIENAIAWYEKSFANAPSPVPSDMLVQICGDLGGNGYFKEIIRIVEPKFDPFKHGITIGSQLARAYIALKDIDNARRIVKMLDALGRPDWKKHLDALRTLIV